MGYCCGENVIIFCRRQVCQAHVSIGKLVIKRVCYVMVSIPVISTNKLLETKRAQVSLFNRPKDGLFTRTVTISVSITVYGNGPFDGQIGFRTHSVCQVVRHHSHNVHLMDIIMVTGTVMVS